MVFFFLEIAIKFSYICITTKIVDEKCDRKSSTFFQRLSGDDSLLDFLVLETVCLLIDPQQQSGSTAVFWKLTLYFNKIYEYYIDYNF